MVWVRCFCLLVMLSLVGCSTVNRHFDPSKPHHRPDGFANNHIAQVNKSLRDLLTWFYEQKRAGLPKPPSAVYASYDAFPVLQPDLRYLAHNRSDNTVTWIGHATSLVQSGGMNVMVDPVFSERASPVQFAGPKRKVRIPATLAELPRIDVVVISHNHFDHLDTDSIQQLNRQEGGPPQFLVPLGVQAWMKAQGVTTVQALDWWDMVKLGTLEFHFVPAQHWSKRTPFDRNATLWGGWVVRSPSWSFYFTGDTGYSKDFAEIGKKFGGFDVSAIAVGAYAPRWFMKEQHIDPEDAVQIHKDVRSKYSYGVHWGTFELTDEPLDQPIVDLVKALTTQQVPSAAFELLKHGQTKIFR
jgi:N-acyl-phosphatidylethanolamine-hydrolysing phospholipase D